MDEHEPPQDWDANRLRQQREFLALPFREKLRRMEQLAEVADRVRRAALRAADGHSPSAPADD